MRENTEKKELYWRFLQTKLREYYLACFRNGTSGTFKILENPIWAELQNLAVSVAGRSFTSLGDFVMLRELLLRLRRYWTRILALNGGDAPCPVSIGDDELAKHRADGKQWNEFKDLLKSRNVPGGRLGWVYKEDFKVQKENLRRVMDGFPFSLEDEEHRAQFERNIKL